MSWIRERGQLCACFLLHFIFRRTLCISGVVVVCGGVPDLWTCCEVRTLFRCLLTCVKSVCTSQRCRRVRCVFSVLFLIAFYFMHSSGTCHVQSNRKHVSTKQDWIGLFSFKNCLRPSCAAVASWYIQCFYFQFYSCLKIDF